MYTKPQSFTVVYMLSLIPSVLGSSLPRHFPKYTQLRAFALAGAHASDAVSGNRLPIRTPLTRHHIGEVFLSGLAELPALACSLCFIQNEPVSQTA